MIKESGIYTLTNEVYHADPCPTPSLSRGTIQELLFKTPAHVYATNKRLNPRYQEDSKDENKFDKGTAAHALFLEGYDVANVVYADDWKKKENQELRKEIRATGKIPMLEKDFDDTQDMVEAAHRQLAQSALGIKNLHETGKPEESFFWQEGKTWCRCRTDWRSNDFGLVLDYKTTTDASPNAFANKITDMGYDIQHAFYKRGVRVAAKLEKNPRFIFMVQEVKKPFLCSFIGLPPEFSQMGKEKVKYGLYMWQKCLESGEWPGYPNDICYVDPKPWALASWEQRAAMIGEE